MNSPVDITYKAEIYQNTNEQWKNINISLSTGNLNQSNKAPAFNTDYLTVRRNERNKYRELQTSSNPRYDNYSREAAVVAVDMEMAMDDDIGNAETYYPINDIDVTSTFFALHEMPRFARQNLIKRTQEYTKKEIVFVDISTDYNPSPHMLIGEPYIKEYLKNIDEDLKHFEKISIIDGQVSMWSLKL